MSAILFKVIMLPNTMGNGTLSSREYMRMIWVSLKFLVLNGAFVFTLVVVRWTTTVQVDVRMQKWAECVMMHSINPSPSPIPSGTDGSYKLECGSSPNLPLSLNGLCALVYYAFAGFGIVFGLAHRDRLCALYRQYILMSKFSVVPVTYEELPAVSVSTGAGVVAAHNTNMPAPGVRAVSGGQFAGWGSYVTDSSGAIEYIMSRLNEKRSEFEVLDELEYHAGSAAGK